MKMRFISAGALIRHGMAALALCATLGIAAAPPAVDARPVAAVPRASRLAEGWEHGAFMEIFVRAWRDSNGDGIGDLRGLTQSLDHLQALGVRGLWLMPITKNADGDHGYATTDFRAVAPEYGTLADFDELIRQAHQRGIGVIMDYVINHASAQHPMFQRALQGPGDRFHSWFVWADAAPQGWDIWGKNPWYHTASKPWLFKGDLKDLPRPAPEARGFYFGTFGPHMPDFDFRNPEVLEYHLASLRFWLNRGLDGFRLDAVPHLIENNARDWNDQPESRALTKRLQDLVKSYPRRMVVCEATAEPQAYGDPAVCGGAFAFGYVHHFIEAARGKAESVRQVAEFYRRASPTMATFLSSHDSFAGRRPWDQLEGHAARLKLAAASYLLQPGTPFIYYGEEIGQAGVPGLAGDLPIRSPMSWTTDPATAGFTTGKPFRPLAPNRATHNVQVQRADPDSIFNFYKAMLGLRNTLPSIARGSFEASFAQGRVAGWQRRWGDETAVVVINYGETEAEATLDALPSYAQGWSAYPAEGAPLRAQGNGQARVAVPAQSLRVWVLQPSRPAQGGPKPRRSNAPRAAALAR
ncbi:MAG: alpha-amylase family glycosyl hydrolase [Rubrivivax sp.]|nr:alpha-amylase family glycosyl hydrolase [Rubrivivax sp.]